MEWALLLALVACGDDDDPIAPPDEADAGGLVIAPPIPPAHAVLVPCPVGWSTIYELEAAPHCLPIRVSPIVDVDTACGEGGEARRIFFGAAERDSLCDYVGEPCPEGARFGEPPSDRPVFYVDPMAETAGDGSRATPFRAIADALAAAPAGATILLAPGEHDGPLRIERDVSLVGTCAGSILQTDTVADVAGVIDVVDAQVSISNLSIRSEVRPGITARDAQVALDGVLIAGAVGAGVVASGGSLRARELVIEDVAPGGVFAGRSLSIDRSAVDLARSRIAIAEGGAILVTGEGATLTATDVAVTRGIRGGESHLGRGVMVTRRATATLERVYVRGAHTSGVLVGDDAELTARRLVIEEVVSQTINPAASVLVENGATASISELLAFDGSHAGLWSRDGADVAISDAVLIGVGAEQATSALRASRARLRAQRIDIVGHRAGATAQLGDLTISDTSIRGTFEQAIGVVMRSQGVFERVRLDETRGGVFVGDSSAICSDCDVSNTLVFADNGRFGRGFEGTSATASLLRFRSIGSHDAAIMARDTTLTGVDIEVAGAAPQSCGATTCADAPGGFGVAIDRGSVSLESFSIRDSALCGVLVAGDTQLTAGEIRDNPIGACVQLEGFDVARLSDRVRYIDNERNLDATTLPIPQPFGGDTRLE